MKGVKKMISILVRIISIARMKLLMLPKAKKPDHFACKMGLQTSFLIRKPCFVGTHGNLLLVTISQVAFLLLAKFCEIKNKIKWKKIVKTIIFLVYLIFNL
jgi:hypothetical protein